jgi:hypothetical protein
VRLELREFADWPDAQASLVLPKSPMAQAISYTQNQWEALRRFTEHGFLNIDNNASERALRAVAVGRKNWLFAGRDAGGQTAAVLYTMVNTCKSLGIDPFRYLQDVLAQLPESCADRLAGLLPLRWAQDQRQRVVPTAK